MTPRPVLSPGTGKYYFSLPSQKKLGVIDPASGDIAYLAFPNQMYLQRASTSTGFLVLESTGETGDIELTTFDTVANVSTVTKRLPGAASTNADFMVDQKDQFWFTTNTKKGHDLLRWNPVSGDLVSYYSEQPERGLVIVGVADNKVFVSDYPFNAFSSDSTRTQNSLLVFDTATGNLLTKIDASKYPHTIISAAFIRGKEIFVVLSQMVPGSVKNHVFKVATGPMEIDEVFQLDFWSTGEWSVRDDSLYVVNSLSGNGYFGIARAFDSHQETEFTIPQK